MPERPFARADIEALRQWDVPTICNGLEVVMPERRALGFTVEPMVAVDPKAPPFVGLARTGTIRAKEPPRGTVANRLDWYDYVANADLPTIVVLQDIDHPPGYGAFWGEVQSTVHKALGAVGCVTNGSFRDLTAWAPGFQMIGGRVGPSHAHVHMVDFGKLVIPADAVRKLPAAIDLVARREKVILDICKNPDFSPARLRDAIKRAGEIH
jgi:hypothetical protein